MFYIPNKWLHLHDVSTNSAKFERENLRPRVLKSEQSGGAHNASPVLIHETFARDLPSISLWRTHPDQLLRHEWLLECYVLRRGEKMQRSVLLLLAASLGNLAAQNIQRHASITRDGGPGGR